MVTSTGQYISGNITETGLMVFGTLTESGEYALNNRVEYMVMSGGMVTCGLISSHAYASNMRHLESTSCDYSFTGTKIDKRFTAMEV